MSTLIGSVGIGGVISYEGGSFKVLKKQHVKPGKGGAFYQIEMKEISTGQKKNIKFRSEDKVERLMTQLLKIQVLYFEGSTIHLINHESGDMYELEYEKDDIRYKFLTEEMEIEGLFVDGKIVDIQLPNRISQVVDYTEPYLKNATITSQTKPATLKNGVSVKVPGFIETGQGVIVSVSEDNEGRFVCTYVGKTS